MYYPYSKLNKLYILQEKNIFQNNIANNKLEERNHLENTGKT